MSCATAPEKAAEPALRAALLLTVCQTPFFSPGTAPKAMKFRNCLAVGGTKIPVDSLPVGMLPLEPAGLLVVAEMGAPRWS
jgi:hypothetical protein